MLAREHWGPVCRKSRRLSGAVGFWRPKLPAALGDRHTADDRAAEAAMARRHHPSGTLDRESAGHCQSPSLLAALLDTGVNTGAGHRLALWGLSQPSEPPARWPLSCLLCPVLLVSL